MKKSGVILLAALAVAAAAAAGVVASRRQDARPIGAPPGQEGDGGGAERARHASIRRFWDAYRRADAARLSGSRERLAEAEAGYREALALDPDHENSLWGLANVLETEGKRDEAIALLRRHIESHPRSTRGFARLGELLSQAGPGGGADFTEAEALFRRAIGLNPEESGGYLNLGRLLYVKDDLDGAEAQFRSALKINFKGLLAARYLALIAYRRGDAEGAARELAPIIERFLADKPKLFALSEGDTIESAQHEKLTSSARDLLPAVETLWLIARAGGLRENAIPPSVRELITRPLDPEAPGGKIVLRLPEGRATVPGGAAIGASKDAGRGDVGARSAVEPTAARVIEADLDGDGIADRFSAGEADAAESAAWILGGKVCCDERAAIFERGIGGGRFERAEPAHSIAACLPAGRVSLRDSGGRREILVESGDADPARIEPDVILIPGRGAWRAVIPAR